MDFVTLRMIAVSLGAVGFIAACGSSPSTANSFGIQPGGNVPDATTAPETGAAASPAPTATASTPPPEEAGPPPSCQATCNVDGDCASPCGNGVWCCMQNMCFSPQSGSCDSGEGGSSDDSGTAAPAPSM